jgi:asparagine synthase (glutamine-hydrolysing)
MCGIAGMMRFDGGLVSEMELKQMCNLLAHRGPDSEGTWIHPSQHVALGHRRLSIIDLSDAAGQPMQYADSRYTIIYNGEIYNYVELKEWLTRFRYEFKTGSDTEVLLALYDFKKEKCLEYLDGMFAFALWDDVEGTLFCARDRFGEKPFFYFNDERHFTFASEIKSIRNVHPVAGVNMQLLQNYINDNYNAQPHESYFNNIHQLPAAHYLIIKNNNLQLHRYWEIDLEKRTRYVRTAQYYEQFHELFLRSVSRRLRSDVKTGSSLSGGLDSSAVVCSIKELNADLSTFSARFPGASGDEGSWIEEVNRKTGFRNYTVIPEADGFLNHAASLVYHHEFPIASTSVYAQYCVMKLARENGVKVLLDGQGADEFLAGYDNLKYFALWELYRKGKIMQFRREVRYFKENFGSSRSVGLKFIYDPVLQLFGKRRKVYDKGYTLRERLKFAIEQELPELLRYADRNSMAHSVEVRLPFLNHQLVEYAFSLPPEQIYQKGRTKFVLREATKHILPPAIYNRKDKIGFAPPEKIWMTDNRFVDEIAAAKTSLKNAGLQQGSSDFRNFIAAKFVKAFL